MLQVEFWLYAMRHRRVSRRMAVLYREFRAQLAPLAAPYAKTGITPVEVVAAVIALYHSLTLQWRSDPEAIRPDLVTRVLRGLERSPRRAPRRQLKARTWTGRKTRVAAVVPK